MVSMIQSNQFMIKTIIESVINGNSRSFTCLVCRKARSTSATSTGMTRF